MALQEQSNSGQTGIAALTARGDKTEVVLLATAGISKANHIHSGTCDSLGGVVYPLTDMADGVSVTSVDATLVSLQAGSFAINLHATGDLSVYTSCANLPTRENTVTIALAELSNSGQSGVATLVAQGDKTEVALYATAGISKANHIHSGHCVDLGGVVYPLTNMVGGISVTTVDATLTSWQTGGFAIPA